MVDKNRTDLLNFLAEKYDLQRYLEIGVQDPAQNFDKIVCLNKTGVDPSPNTDTTFCMTSDGFFGLWESLRKCEEGRFPSHTGLNAEYMTSAFWHPFDLIFIDGLHTAEQVMKDFENALKVLSPNGFIVLHDCNPLKEEHTIVPRPTKTGHWNGDVYKFAASMPKYPFWTVDIDNGCMVIKPEKDYFNDGIEWPKYIDWNFFDANRKELLNLIIWDEFVSIGSLV